MMGSEEKRFVLRLPGELHADLVEMAEADSRSLHNLITLLLRREATRWKRMRDDGETLTDRSRRDGDGQINRTPDDLVLA